MIDVSGDGPNNHGWPVEQARNAALARGIVINGLPLMTDEGMDRLAPSVSTAITGTA